MFARGSAPDDEFLQLLLQQQLALQTEQRERCRRRLQPALCGMDEAMISTIHGFCHAALQDHALLSGRQFESEAIADDRDYWESSLKDWWRSTTYTLRAPEWTLLDEALGGLPGLLEIYRNLSAHPHDGLLPAVETPLAQLLATHRGTRPGDDDFEPLICRLRVRALIEAREFARPRVEAAKRAQAQIAYQDQLDQLLVALGKGSGEQLAVLVDLIPQQHLIY